MKPQSVPLRTLRQNFHHALRVPTGFEAHDGVIRIVNQHTASAQPRTRLGLEPLVQHVVKVHLRQPR